MSQTSIALTALTIALAAMICGVPAKSDAGSEDASSCKSLLSDNLAGLIDATDAGHWRKACRGGRRRGRSNCGIHSEVACSKVEWKVFLSEGAEGTAVARFRRRSMADCYAAVMLTSCLMGDIQGLGI